MERRKEEKIMKSNKIKCTFLYAEFFQQSESVCVLWFSLCGKQRNISALLLISLWFSMFWGEGFVYIMPVPSVSWVMLHWNFYIRIVISRGIIMVQAPQMYG